MEENKEKVYEEPGTVKISEDVVAIIAGIATSEIAGVYSMSGTIAGGIVELLGGKKNATKGIRVELDDNDVSVDIHITVIYGFKIPDVAWEIQEKVKSRIEEITGLNVIKVNVHVDGVNMEKPKKDDAEEAEQPVVETEE